MLKIFNTSICWQMGWVKVNEYDLGFSILDTLTQVNPNEKNYNEKHTMETDKNVKKIHL